MARKSYDVSSKINIYEQITSYSCAVTCACMSLKRSPQTMKNDGIDLEWADWDGIAREYGYNTYTGTASLKGVIEILKKGYPAISKIKSGSSPHWVNIISFNGDENNPQPEDFECADPSNKNEDIINLEDTVYKSIYVTRYFTGKF